MEMLEIDCSMNGLATWARINQAPVKLTLTAGNAEQFRLTACVGLGMRLAGIVRHFRRSA